LLVIENMYVLSGTNQQGMLFDAAFEDAVRRCCSTPRGDDKMDAREYYLRVFIGMDMDIEYLYLLSGTSPAAADELLAKMLFDAAWVR
jgi:hypothetical protein